MVKPYNIFRVNVLRYIILQSMFVGCFIAEIIQRWISSYAKPLWLCICHAIVYRHAKFECKYYSLKLNIVRDVDIKLQLNIC